MLRKLGLLIVLFITVGCNTVSDKVMSCEGLSFSEYEIYRQIKLENVSYVKCLINSLVDSDLSDCDFANRVFSISDHLNFMYCGIDCEDREWQSLTRSKKDSTRTIIARGLKIYQESSLFMSKVDAINCAYGDIYAFCKSDILSEEKFRKSFRKELEDIFKNCSSPNN